jgi:glutaredoxin 3
MTGIMTLLEKAPTDFLMVTTTICPYCNKAKGMMNAKGLTFEEHSLSENPALQREVVQLTGHRTVPAIWDLRGDVAQFVGGSDDLESIL